MAIRRMRIACWIPKATATHSEYVMLFNSINGYASAPHYYVCTNIASLVECETWWFKPLGCDALLFGREWLSRRTSVYCLHVHNDGLGRITQDRGKQFPYYRRHVS